MSLMTHYDVMMTLMPLPLHIQGRTGRCTAGNVSKRAVTHLISVVKAIIHEPSDERRLSH